MMACGALGVFAMGFAMLATLAGMALVAWAATRD